MSQRPLRIAVYCCDYYPAVSGYSFAFQDLVRGLGEHPAGVEVDVFTPVPLASAEEVSLRGVRVIRVDLPARFAGVPVLPALWNLFAKPWLTSRTIAMEHRNRDYDFLVAETIEDPLALRFLPAELRARTMVRVHACMETEVVLWGRGAVFALRRRLIGHVLRHHVRFIAATSHYYLGFVKRWYLREDELLIAGKRFCVIENSAPMLGGVPRHGFARPDRVHFMTLGRMDWQGANQKGFDDILLALLHLDPAARQRVQLTVVGKGTERARLMQLASGIEGATVEFIESMPNNAVREHLQTVDCVILASRYEGMSVFALEALGSACPVIYSSAGGIADLVDGNGYQFPAGDAHALAERIGRFLSLADSDLRRMSERSLQLAAGFTPRAAAERLLEFSRLITAHDVDCPASDGRR
ncbi:MAG: glycosyltransferase family 4 protein [Rubrivivax sp.]|nr:glycosyltransferase family 4 protein [Rubrivivax sp.]MDP3612538.1 glycosyltransferase family 4 protein [Rubrivivax sp.]